MRLHPFTICFMLLALASCEGEEPVIDKYPWVNNYTGDFRVVMKGTSQRIDLFSGGPFPPATQFNWTKDHLISRLTDNKIDLRSSETGLRKWTIDLDENLQFSLSKDTAYVEKCNGCGSGHHVTYSIKLSGFFFNTDSLKFNFSEKATDRENGVTYTASGEAFSRRIK